jgi:multidrug resistance protein MdtO
MAMRVAERLERFARLLAPTSGRLSFAARLALVCALTAVVVEYYQNPEPALTAYIAFFVIKPDRATSVLLSIIMTLLISLIIAALVVVTMAVADEPFWRVSAMAAISFGLLFLASASKLKPIGGIVALIAAFALDLLGQVHVAEIATRGLLYAWLFVATPAGLSIVVNLLFGPPPRRLVERALAGRLEACAARLRDDDADRKRAFREVLGEIPDEVPSWLKAASLERTTSSADLLALKQAAQSTTSLLLLVDQLLGEDLLEAPWRARIADTLDEMAGILKTGGYPVEVALSAPSGARPLRPRAAALVREMAATLAGFATPTDAPAMASPAPRAGFLAPDAFSNPVHTRFALKTTAAAMFCYLTYSLLDWPGIHTCLITCYIIAQGTAAETIQKLGLRVAGAVLGGALGLAAIIWIAPQITTVGPLAALVFAGAFVAAWIAAGRQRIAYAGFQLAFAFFLCVLQGPTPAFDLTIGRDRVIGVLFGNLVVYLLFTHLWPVSVGGRIDPALSALLGKLADLARAGRRAQRAALAGEAQAAANVVAQDLELAAYEPANVRPAARWLATRRRTLRRAAALIAPLLAGMGRREVAKRRLETLARSVEASLPADIDRRFSALERALARPPARRRAHAPV